MIVAACQQEPTTTIGPDKDDDTFARRPSIARLLRFAAVNDPSDARHATNLELFLDLVFVFAVTQITGYLSQDLAWPTIGRSLIISWLVWSLWAQFTWAGAAIDLQRDWHARLIVLISIPVTLVLVIAVPRAYDDLGPWFGGAYFVVQALVLTMQGWTAVANPVTRRSFLQFSAIASISPMLVLIGGFIDGNGRVLLWGISATLFIVAGLIGARGEWAINPSHFVERHGLFVIIALGEVLVAIGAAANEAGLNATVLLGVLVCAAGACVYWWTYFAFLPNVCEHVLNENHGARRAQLARDLLTFGHFPIVGGIIAYSVVVHHVTPNPTESLAVPYRALLAASVVLILCSYLHTQFRVVHRLARERIIAVVATVALCAGGGALPAWSLVALIVTMLTAMQAVTYRNFRNGGLAYLTT